MNTPFASGFKVTQQYGNDVEYYKNVSGGKLQHGHEGVDLVPNDPGDTNILCVEVGTVVRSGYDKEFYGNYCVILNMQNKRSWWYCHMATIPPAINTEKKTGEQLGVMGDSGNAIGAHLHLGMRNADERGMALNEDNGSLGFVDPLPILQSLQTDAPNTATMIITVKERDILVNKSSQWDKVADYLQLDHDDAVGGTKAVKKYAEDSQEILNREEQVRRLEDQMTQLQSSYNDIYAKWDEANKQVGALKIQLASNGMIVPHLNTNSDSTKPNDNVIVVGKNIPNILQGLANLLRSIIVIE